MYSTKEIAEFCSQHTTLKRATKVAERYLNTVKYHILLGFTRARADQSAQGHFPISTRTLHFEIGKYGPNKNQQYWFPLLHKHFPLFEILKKGNSIQGEQTVAKTDIDLEVLLAGQDVGELFDKLYSELDFSDATQYDLAPINLKNLKNFIDNTNNDRYRATARLIELVASATKGVLPMQILESSFGRKYYKGLNLQSCSKVVREAALGPCYAVDIENAVVNWKYAMMDSETQQRLTYTREYIHDKNRIRKYLANVVFGNTQDYSIQTIKRVMTAIGFGARGETRCWYRDSTGAWIQGSISQIIKSLQLRNQLFTDKWMMHYMMEQQHMNSALETALRPVFQQDSKLKQLVLTESGKRISVQKMIAMAYQHAERAAMEALDEYSNSERILLVHDGAYYKTRPDIGSMQTVLRDHFPEARLEMKQIQPWQPRAEINQEHIDFIKSQEALANGGQIVTTTHAKRTVTKQLDPHAEPDWEQLFEDPELEPQQPDWLQDILSSSKNNSIH